MPSASGRNWQDATSDTIRRIQQIFSIDDSLSRDDKLRLYQLAATIASSMVASSGTDRWNIFVNTLRTLVAGQSDCDPKKVFD